MQVYHLPIGTFSCKFGCGLGSWAAPNTLSPRVQIDLRKKIDSKNKVDQDSEVPSQQPWVGNLHLVSDLHTASLRLHLVLE